MLEWVSHCVTIIVVYLLARRKVFNQTVSKFHSEYRLKLRSSDKIKLLKNASEIQVF